MYEKTWCQLTEKEAKMVYSVFKSIDIKLEKPMKEQTPEILEKLLNLLK